jgi:purine-nucleoside phosphorylase
MFEKVTESANYIKSKIEGRKPEVGIILGSGLGEFAERAENKIEIDYNDIPHFHKTSVKGHKGKLIIGEISGVEVAIFQGRFHAYEGHSLETVVMPVRSLCLLGVKKVIITNAAGGINTAFKPGDLVCISDHINLTGTNPLIGKNNDEYGERFPDMTEAYNKELSNILVESAKEVGFELKKGIYAAVSGPSYETPAEIQMLKVIGADMVGMSTFAETIAANHLGVKTAGISCITNLAAGLGQEKLYHDEVKEVANLAMEKFTNLLTMTIKRLK